MEKNTGVSKYFVVVSIMKKYWKLFSSFGKSVTFLKTFCTHNKNWRKYYKIINPKNRMSTSSVLALHLKSFKLRLLNLARRNRDLKNISFQLQVKVKKEKKRKTFEMRRALASCHMWIKKPENKMLDKQKHRWTLIDRNKSLSNIKQIKI